MMPTEEPLSSMYRERVLVSGAIGFIGSHLCRSLSEEGADVCGLSRREMGCVDNSISWLAGDVVDIATVRRVVREVEPGIIYRSLVAVVTTAQRCASQVRRSAALSLVSSLCRARSMRNPEICLVVASRTILRNQIETWMVPEMRKCKVLKPAARNNKEPRKTRFLERVNRSIVRLEIDATLVSRTSTEILASRLLPSLASPGATEGVVML